VSFPPPPPLPCHRFRRRRQAWRGDRQFCSALDVSATPVVGPDCGGKNDNHAIEGFHHEGERLRKFLNSVPGCFVINGDRHWQYHSVDPETGLNEFGFGPASDADAQGWNPKDKRPEQKFLRVKGGYASITVDGTKDTSPTTTWMMRKPIPPHWIVDS